MVGQGAGQGAPDDRTLMPSQIDTAYYLAPWHTAEDQAFKEVECEKVLRDHCKFRGIEFHEDRVVHHVYQPPGFGDHTTDTDKHIKVTVSYYENLRLRDA